MTNLTCERCRGAKITVRAAFTTQEGVTYPRKESPCFACDGRGDFPPVDVPAILEAIKGRKSGSLRSARPNRKHGGRPYYVWRMARFHGGADVTMPVMASIDVAGDPFVKELDMLADAFAKRAFGTHMAATHRWGHALGYLNSNTPDLPATAYPCGPVKT
jgi:hypothetical protein